MSKYHVLGLRSLTYCKDRISASTIEAHCNLYALHTSKYLSRYVVAIVTTYGLTRAFNLF